MNFFIIYILTQIFCYINIHFCSILIAKKVYFLSCICYNIAMKHTPLFKNDEIIQHIVLNKSSTQNLKPKILYAGDMKPTESWNAQPHGHDFCEIIYVRSGSGILHLDSGDLPFEQGDILIHNPHVKHKEGGNDLSCYFFAINKFKLENLPENHLIKNESCPIIHTGNEKNNFEFYFSQLVSEAKNKQYYYDDISDNLVRIILGKLLRILTQSDSQYFKTNEIYSNAKKYIDENFVNIKNIDDICKVLFISRYYLTHLFKEYSGISPIKYIITKRIELAKSLLTETDLPIDEIADKTGYSEVNSFIKTFKNVENITPAAFRTSKK